MELGVDFGTTRIVVAAADRGNYPLAGFETPDGQIREWFPPLVAVRNQTRLFGWQAAAVQGNREWTVLRSLKRRLKSAGTASVIDVGGREMPLTELLVELLVALRQSLRRSSTLNPAGGEALQVTIGVPANANSNQRFLTAEAFRSAGFQVLGMLNEPSAASIEYGHRRRAERKGQPRHTLLVYDLGGGTFDASLVDLVEDTHTVVAAAGLSDVGGDDFDEILAGLALAAAPGPAAERESLTGAEQFRLLEECRERKESLNPNTRKVTIDLDRVREGWGEVTVPVSAFYEGCRPLIDRTARVVEQLLASRADGPIETLYVTGGGSELPAVARVLKESFGRSVRRSSYMRSATAIGLAIGADARSGYRLRDRFTRHFGVWREAEHGRKVAFDVLFPRGLGLPAPGAPAHRVLRSYAPAHNVGCFRYVEASHLDADGEPVGDLTFWDEIQFPFDPGLRDVADLSLIAVERGGEAAQSQVEEEYWCDAGGMLKVKIANRSAGYSREFALGRWSESPQPSAGLAAARRHRLERRNAK
ncbi:MAG: Hsp70 family protein [Bryobacteraceae bacterium]|jgi:molecular chaperone DnaK (HSP70)